MTGSHVIGVDLYRSGIAPAALTRPPHPTGVVVATVPVETLTTNSAPLYSAVLEATGADPGATGATMQNTDLWWITLSARVTAFGITDLVLVGADDVRPQRFLTSFCHRLRTLPITIWLASHTGLHNLPAVDSTATTQDLLDLLARPSRPPAPENIGALADLDLPDTTFVSFRHDCRTSLSDRDFHAVDAIYEHAWHHTNVELARHQTVDSRTIATLITDLAAPHLHTNAHHVVIMAVRAAAFAAGYATRLNHHQLLGRLAANPSLAHCTPQEWDSLRAVHATWRAAAVALLAADLTIDQMRDLAVDDVAADATTVTVDGRPVTVPVHARPYLRAHLELRHHTPGRRTSTTFLSWQPGKKDPVPAHNIVQALKAIALDTDLPIPTGDLPRTRPRPTIPTDAITVHQIGDPLPTATATRTPPPPPPSRTTNPIALNHRLMRRQRERAGLSTTELGHRIATGRRAIERLERGANASSLTISQLHTLARTIAVDPHTLLTPHDHTPGDVPDDTNRDARTLASVLFDADRSVSTTDLCRILGWTTSRLAELVDELRAVLEPAGIHLDHTDGRLRLRALPLDNDIADQLAAADLRRHDLTIRDQTNLHTAAHRQPLRTRKANHISIRRLRATNHISGPDQHPRAGEAINAMIPDHGRSDEPVNTTLDA